MQPSLAIIGRIGGESRWGSTITSNTSQTISASQTPGSVASGSRDTWKLATATGGAMSAVNLLRNSTMGSVVAGSPGTLPTNYSSSLAGTTQTLATGTDATTGFPYLEWHITGTASGNVLLFFETATGVACSPSSSYVFSTYGVLSAGSMTNVSVVSFDYAWNDSSGNYIGQATNNQTPASSAVLYTTPGTTASNAAFIQPFIAVASSGAIDLTLRFFGMQLQSGASASAFQPTPITNYGVSKNGTIDVSTPGTSTLEYLYHTVYRGDGTHWWAFNGTSWVYTGTSITQIVGGVVPYGTSPPSSISLIDPHTQGSSVSPLGWQVGWFEDFTSVSVLNTNGGNDGKGQVSLADTGTWDVASVWGGYGSLSAPWPGNLTIINDSQGRATIGQFSVTNTNNNGTGAWDACGIFNRQSIYCDKWGLWEVNAKLGPVAGSGGIALWLSGLDEWPPEVDIMEQITMSSASDMAVNFHELAGDPAPQNTHGAMSFDSTTGFHTYSLLLCPNYAAWYADGVLTGVLYRSGVGTPVLTGLTGISGSGPTATSSTASAYGNDVMTPLTGIFAYSTATSAELPMHIWVDWIRFSVLNAS